MLNRQAHRLHGGALLRHEAQRPANPAGAKRLLQARVADELVMVPATSRWICISGEVCWSRQTVLLVTFIFFDFFAAMAADTLLNVVTRTSFPSLTLKPRPTEIFRMMRQILAIELGPCCRVLEPSASFSSSPASTRALLAISVQAIRVVAGHEETNRQAGSRVSLAVESCGGHAVSRDR